MNAKLVRCPFNPRHVMTQDSLQRHVIRCMVNYPDWVTCPYNALHKYPDNVKLTQHMLSCQSKEKMYFMLNYYESEKKDNVNDVPIHFDCPSATIEGEEDWDKDYQ